MDDSLEAKQEYLRTQILDKDTMPIISWHFYRKKKAKME